jgi:hypothetical protein
MGPSSSEERKSGDGDREGAGSSSGAFTISRRASVSLENSQKKK